MVISFRTFLTQPVTYIFHPQQKKTLYIGVQTQSTLEAPALMFFGNKDPVLELNNTKRNSIKTLVGEMRCTWVATRICKVWGCLLSLLGAH